MTRRRSLVPFVLLALGAAGAHARRPGQASPARPVADVELRVLVLPEPAYLERGDGALFANWDLLVENDGERGWQLARLQVSAFDVRGALEWRKFVDGNGVSPGLRTIPVREVGPGGRLLILNPLHAFPADLELARIAFELRFESAGPGAAVALDVSADVRPVRHENRAELHLPLAGRFIVWDGHDYTAHHRRWDYTVEPLRSIGFDGNAMRYSYDFVPVDETGAMAHGDEDANESWLGFGQPIHAPAAGTVVAVVDERPDDRRLDMESLAADLRNVFGNYVVVDHGHGEHSVFGHIRQGSARVRAGEKVVAGQELAAIGASGSSLFPHLHYQLQDASTGNAEGLPSLFHDFRRVRASRKIPVERGHVDSGDILESEPPLASAPAPSGREGVPVRVDARVELLTLVFRLIGANEYDQPASRSPYSRAVEEWFEPARDHEVLWLAGRLREEHGIGFDAVPSLALHLTPPPELALRMPLEPWPERLESRWRGADLAGFLRALRAFAADTDFLAFLAGFEATQRAAEESLASAIASTHVLDWLREFFGLEAGTTYVAVPGLLCGPGNYGECVRLPDGTLELWPVIGADQWDAEGTPVYDARHVGTVVHEFTHAFANPVVDAHWTALAPAFERLFPSVKDVMARQAYGTPKTVACESLVRACVVRHAARHLGPEAARRQVAEEVARGFAWTGELAALLERYEAERATYPTLRDFGPRLAEFFDEVARRGAAAEKPPSR